MTNTATFTPAVTLVEQPDGSIVAEVDWANSLIYAEVDGVEVETSVLPERLDTFLKERPSFWGFVIPSERGRI